MVHGFQVSLWASPKFDISPEKQGRKIILSDVGLYSLCLAIGVACVQALLLVFTQLPFAARKLALVQFVLVLMAFLTLMTAFVNSDFSLVLVAHYSHSTKPLIYKIAAVWGNHEGSMLLFVLIHTLFGALFALKPTSLSPRMVTQTLGVHAILSVCFLAYICVASNPFARFLLPPLEGNGLNPMLQDPSMAIHPPMLYMGYVGYSLCFALSLVLMGQKTLPDLWVKEMRVWSLLPWTFLTLGIALGSWWAYYELGWGGWWYWDPVENASLMPWLIGTALVHSLVLSKHQKRMVKLSLVLALVPFLMSVFGTFIVRSGLIDSVHAFARDPARGIILISFLMVLFAVVMIYCTHRFKKMDKIEPGLMTLKEKLLGVNSLIFMLATLLILVGTALPSAMGLINKDGFTLGPDFFDQTFIPLMIPLLIILPLGLYMRWDDQLKDVIRRMAPLFAAAMILAWLLSQMYGSPRLYVVFGVGLSLWLILGTGLYALKSTDRFMKRSAIFLSHLGLGVSILGMVVSGHWHLEATLVMKENTRLEFAGYYLTLQDLREVQGPNYLSLMADILVEKNGAKLNVLHPERRLYPVEKTSTHEVAIHTNFLSDIYVILGQEDPMKRGMMMQLHYYPLIPFIWLGVFLMVLGGVLGLLRHAEFISASRRGS